MGHFSVNYQGLSAAMDVENKIHGILDDTCMEIMAVCANVSTQPALASKGYTGKLWNVYSQTVRVQGDIYRMNQGLKRVYDAYMQYEGKVISSAEESLTGKNGFSKAAVSVVARANKQQGALAKSEKQIDNSFGKILYGSTVAAWAANWKQTDKILSKVREYQKNGGKNLVENAYEWMRQAGAPSWLIDRTKTMVGKVDGTVSKYEDILQAIFHMDDPAYTKIGVSSFKELVGGGLVGSALELSAPDSYLAKRLTELQDNTVQAIQTGNYGQAAVLLVGSGVETLGKGTVDVGCRWASATIDSGMGAITETIFGEKITLSGAWDSLEDAVGINPGKIFNSVTADIGDGVSSALDTFAGWFGKK